MARRLVRLSLAPLSMIAGHSAFVYYKQSTLYQKPQVKQDPDAIAVFNPQTIDELVEDNIQSGDIVLFRRKWYLNYLPIGVSLLLYRYMLNSEFDHCGIVLTDRYGKAYIVENHPIKGLQCLPYNDRITYSDEEIILLYPLLPQDRINSALSLFPEPQNHLRYQNNQIVGFCKFILQSLPSFLGIGSSSTQKTCPNLDFVTSILDQLDIEVSPLEKDQETFTMNDLIDKNLRFSSRKNILKSTTAKNNKEIHELYLSEENILLRTR